MVQLDTRTLANTIRTLDGRSLVEIARHVLRVETGGVAEVTDGPWDRGVDLQVTRGGRQLRVQAQCKSGGAWERELKRHIAAMPRQPTTLWWFTTERVTEATREKLKRELLDPRAITVEWFDGNRIAAIALEHGFADVVLREARLPGPVAIVRRPTLAERTAYAIAAFSEDAGNLRRSVDDAILLDVLYDSQGRSSLRDLLERTRERLQLHDAAEPRLIGAIERLRQTHRLRGPNGVVELTDEERARITLVRENLDREAIQLRALLAAALDTQVHPSAMLEAVVDTLMDEMGLLLLHTGRTLATSGGGPTERGHERLRQLRLELKAQGLQDADKVLGIAVQTAESAPLARHLVTGEVWRLTSNVPRASLLATLGTVGLHDPPTVVLDANVAMPMLLGLEYTPPPLRFFLAANHTWRQATRLGLRLVVPTPWLEEMASQLVDAARYAPIMGEDPDLVGSHNVFVSFYAALGRPPDRFLDYLQNLGLPRGLVSGDFFVARDHAARGIRDLLHEQDIETIPVSTQPQREQQERWDFLHRAEGKEPPADIKARHDLQVVAWLEQPQSGPVLLCTWHQQLHRMANAHGWEPVDPEALGDLLALAADPEEFQPRGLAFACAALHEEDHRRGAEVWAKIVRIEQERLENGDLRTEARSFKDDWLQRNRSRLRDDDVIREWEAWKRRKRVS